MAQQESPAFKQLKDQLREMFQLDRGDLDFGIYRIMNQKRGEVTKFLDEQLLPQVRTILEEYQPASASSTQDELNKLLASLNDAGVDPETSPKVKELRAKVGQSVDINKLENEIYSDLYNFFKRYYSEGDFMSMRRYKEGVYALPYEGEEVKLHWANHDQYYIKTSEDLKNYSFKTAGGKKRVRFEVVAGGTETNNNKAAEGKERRFVLHSDAPVQANGDELTIRFEYRPDDAKRKQDDLHKEALEQILNLAEATAFGLKDKAPSEKNADRTLLEKHLTDYTAKNSFDYFIHKDLGKFLQQELDFFIKNEIIHLDDIENETAPKVETYLAKVKAMRKVAGKIIKFVAQLEDFQKKIWLKKKFVLETHYCVTLNHIINSDVADELLPIIATNDAQREEWVKLFAIDKHKGDLTAAAYSNPLKIEFLKTNDKLLVDTKFFDMEFKYKLLSVFDNLDEKIGGLLINSENFQALNFTHAKYAQKVKSVYIDPPYNTSASEIIYKNSYKNSSWLSLMEPRLSLAKRFMRADGVICVTIDDFEFHRLRSLMENIWGKEGIIGLTAIKNNPSGRSTAKGFSIAHEYAIFAANDVETSIGRLSRSENQIARYKEEDEQGKYEWVNFRKHGGANAERIARPKLFYPIFVSDSGEVRIPKMEWNDKKREWALIESPGSKEYVVYPVNQKGEDKTWKWGHETVLKKIQDVMSKPDQTGELGVYMKARMNEEGSLPLSLWDKTEYSATEYGTNLLTNIMGSSNLFSFPKSVHATADCLRVSNLHETDIAMDFFGGSGTTGHATISLNREDGGDRKFILVEMGTYFHRATLPRIKKVTYSSKWKNGEPVLDDGLTQVIKYLTLEQYEDALDNLGLSKSETQAALLASNPTLNEQYMLGYMLDVESRGSQSLLNIDAFVDPFAYTLRITRNDDTKVVNVDLIETFNYLLGLSVRTIDRDKSGIVTVTGKNSLGENCLIIWRNVNDIDNGKLDAWFSKRYSSKDFEFDAIYVNGDNNIENMKLADDHWKVRLIEAEFKRLMFDVSDV
jgi:adenine-specific DNA-methyltransferase